MSLDDLNAEQRAAVLAPEDRVLVLAGAGSGKTRTLVERVAHMLEHGASGYEIVCVTFTRAAAAEMRNRLKNSIGREAGKITVSTFHGLGLALLKKYGQHIGLRYGRLTVYTPLETDALLEHCGEMLGLFSKGKWKPGKRDLDAFMAALERGESDEALRESPYAPLRAAFEAACLQNNALPYYGLVQGLVKLAEAGIVRQYTSWQHFLVDEVQDMDKMQWEALRLMLMREGASLFAVGDIAQSIYSFRGAVPQYLQSLIEAGKLAVYELRSNYRSMPDIVRMANDLIRHNASHRTIEMQPVATQDSPAVLCAPDMNSAALADQLVREKAAGTAVLCRNNRMLDKLSRELAARGEPHLRIGRSTDDLRSPLFVRANALLKCIVNPYDETAFLLAHRALGITAQQYANIRVTAAAEGKSSFTVYQENLTIEELSVFPPEDATVAQARDFFAGEHSYHFDPADGDRENYLDWLAAYATAHPDNSIADYLDWIALADAQDEMPAGDLRPDLVLMTCHAAKGLEFERVFIAGCNEGVLPGRQALTAEKKGHPEAMEDERRLMYVAVTRAQRRLVLAVRPTESHFPASCSEPPSRFLAEMNIRLATQQ